MGMALDEWLETDGRGGYAAGTPALRRTRRYHGLLVGVPAGTAERHLYLAGFAERVACGDQTLTLAPWGEERDVAPVAAFAARPWPRATLGTGDLVCERQLLLHRETPATLVRYAVRTRGDLEQRPDAETWTLALAPVLAFRRADGLTVRNHVLRPTVETVPLGIRLRPYDALPALTLTLSAGSEPSWTFEPAPRWIPGLRYPTDEARGYEGSEDLFCPGRFVIRVRRTQAVTVAASVDGVVANPGAAWREATRARRAAAKRTSGTRSPAAGVRARLARAAEDFLYRDAHGRPGVLAGLPWFGEWGRDTFIALPGLTLACGRPEACADVLVGATRFLQDGLLPNVYGATPADTHYGRAAAALWYARAVRLYDRAGGDADVLMDTCLPALRQIATAYRAGTADGVRALGIRADEDALLHAGAPELNPTWMDAQTANGPVTPRHGAPVELAALWCALLDHLAELLARSGADAEAATWRASAEQAGQTFLARFVLPSGALADVWRPDGVDAAIRPNMVLAAALEGVPLPVAERRAVVDVATRELLTPYGLRTLAPGDAAYARRYGGGPEARDGAYHQGTVWPWLLGFYCEAALRVDASEANRAHLRGLWDTLAGELDHGCREHLAEVHDAEPPHHAGGTFAQAWNTAEMLRALVLIEGGA